MSNEEAKKFLPKEFHKFASSYSVPKAKLVGSKATCDPVPEDTDTDILFLLRDRVELEEFVKLADELGFEIDDGYEEALHENDKRVNEYSFISLKHFEDNDLNLIVTLSREFWRKYTLATSVAKELNLLDKEHRIMLFQAILYSQFYKVKGKQNAGSE